MRNADDQASLLERTTYLVGLIESMIHCHDAKEVEVWETFRKAPENGWGKRMREGTKYGNW